MTNLTQITLLSHWTLRGGSKKLVGMQFNIELNHNTIFVRFRSSEKFNIPDSTASQKFSHSTTFLLHLSSLQNNGWCMVFDLTVIIIGSWSEFPICSPTFQVHLSYYVLPTGTEVLMPPVIRLIGVWEPSFNSENSLSNILSSICAPL